MKQRQLKSSGTAIHQRRLTLEDGRGVHPAFMVAPYRRRKVRSSRPS